DSGKSRTALFLCGRPAPFGAGVGAERSFHLPAGHAPAEIAAHAGVVDVGEADLEPARARLAQARLDRAELHMPVELLEFLLQRALRALAAQVDRPPAHHVRGNAPQIRAPAVHARSLVGLP